MVLVDEISRDHKRQAARERAKILIEKQKRNRLDAGLVLTKVSPKKFLPMAITDGPDEQAD